MKERRESLIPIPADWDPTTMALLIEKEAERWWDRGWVFVRAETDALMENCCLIFERPLVLDEEMPPPANWPT